jgi:hypothetical protein
VRRLRAKLGAEHESMIDTVRGVGYMAPTPPHPEWILTEATLTTVWTSTGPPATNGDATVNSANLANSKYLMGKDLSQT